MNAVNLIAMMLAAQETLAPQKQTDSQLLPNSMDFLLQLQQQVLAGGNADSGLLDSLTTSLEGVDTQFPMMASLIGGVEAESGGQAWSLGEILGALIDSLRQVLDAGAARAQTAAPAGDQSHASWNLTAAGSAIPTDQFSSATLPPGWQIQQLLQAQWSDVVALLGGQLAGEQTMPVDLSATALTAGAPARSSPALPYASALLIQQTVSATFSSADGGKLQGSPSQALPGLLADAPASIQWFNSLALLASQPVVAADAAAPATLTAELELPDGQMARVSLSELAQSMQLSQRSLTVSIELPSEGAAVLTATLTIQRVPPAAVAVMPGLQAGATAQPVPQPAAAIPVAGDGAGIVAAPQLASVDSSLHAGGATAVINADTGAASSADSPLTPVAQTQSVAQLQAGQGRTGIDGAMTPAAGGQSVDSGRNAATNMEAARYALLNGEAAGQNGGYAISDQLRPSLKAMPTLIASAPAVEQSQAAARQTAVNRTSWTAQMALDQLNGAQQQPSIITLKQAATPEPQVQLAGQQPSLDAIEMVAVNASNDPLAPQLMEFVGSSLETSQFAGLEYLEMAQRIMERVAAARSAGNGLYNAHLDLNPPNLGKMFVNISVRGDAVALQIAVASTVPKEQLKDSLDALRQSLEDAGLYVVELQVHEIDADEDRSGGQQQSGAERDDSAHQEGNAAVKTTPSLSAVFKSTPAIGFGG